MNSGLLDFAKRLCDRMPSIQGSDFDFPTFARELFALQFEANSTYRRVCEMAHITPRTLTDWQTIPLVPTAAFKEFEVTSLPPEQRTHVFHSSGTTVARPSRHFHCAESLAVYEASLWAWFERHLLPRRGVELAVLTPPSDRSPHSSLVHMFAVICWRLGAPVDVFLGKAAQNGLEPVRHGNTGFPTGQRRTEWKVGATGQGEGPGELAKDLAPAWLLDLECALARLQDAVDHNTPLLLLGTAFSFVHLLDELAARKLRFSLPPGSSVMETGGYKGRSRSLPKSELHALVTKLLGVPPSRIVCEYGMSELSSQAYDSVTGGGCQESADAGRTTHRAPRLFRFPPWARVQIVSPETGRKVANGETGLIRVFDLANVWSVMAVQTEDLGVRRGDGFELLGRATLAESRGCSLMPA